MNINQEWLHSFETFARCLNFTHAARTLNISQPALHVQVKKLTESLGMPLYRRVGRHLELTEEGRRVSAYAGEQEVRWNEFFKSLQSGDTNSPVSLVAGQGAYLYLLGDAIATFRQQSKAPLQLITEDNNGCIEAVCNGRAHLGVTVLTRSTHELEAIPLKRIPFSVAMRADHPLASLEEVTPAHLIDFPLVVPPEGRPHRQALNGLLEGHRMKVAVEANGWELMLFFVSLNLGVAVVNGCCRMPEGVVKRPFSGLAPITYHLIHRQTDFEESSRAQLKKQIIESLLTPTE